MSNREAVDPRALNALVAAVETGSFRAAATQLGYTQSAVSHQIAVLERQLGVQLFVRPGGRRRVQLTALGELTYQHAQRVLAANQALEVDLAAALAGRRGTLRIGISQSSGFLLVEPLALLQRNSPEIDVSLVNTATAGTLKQQIAQGQLDFGVYVNVEPDERVATIPLLEDSWAIIARQDSVLARSGPVHLDALDNVRTIAWPQRWRAQANLEQEWRRRRIRPRIVYRTEDSLMIQWLVAAGLGAACIGSLSVQQLIDPHLRRVPLLDDLPGRTLSLCYSRDRELSPPAVAVIESIQTLTSRPSRHGTAAATAFPA